MRASFTAYTLHKRWAPIQHTLTYHNATKYNGATRLPLLIISIIILFILNLSIKVNLLYRESLIYILYLQSLVLYSTLIKHKLELRAFRASLVIYIPQFYRHAFLCSSAFYATITTIEANINNNTAYPQTWMREHWWITLHLMIETRWRPIPAPSLLFKFQFDLKAATTIFTTALQSQSCKILRTPPTIRLLHRLYRKICHLWTWFLI